MGGLLIEVVIFISWVLVSPVALILCSRHLYKRIKKNEFRRLSISLISFSMLIGIATAIENRKNIFWAAYSSFSLFTLSIIFSVVVVWYVNKVSKI